MTRIHIYNILITNICYNQLNIKSNPTIMIKYYFRYKIIYYTIYH